MPLTSQQLDDKFERMCKNAHRDDNGCLLWDGFRDASGCGRIIFNKGRSYAHIVSYKMYHRLETIEKGMFVIHKVGCPAHCFEPTHLRLGTAADKGQHKVNCGTSLVGERNPRVKITAELAKSIYDNRSTSTLVTLALKHNTTVGIAYGILTGRIWNSVTGLPTKKRKPRYVDDAIGRIITEPKIQERLKSKFKQHTNIDADGCYLWSKQLDPNGYATVSIAGCGVSAHVAAWVLHHQQAVPDGLVVRHSCIQKYNCCNPDHLSIGTPKQNSDDQLRDGTRPYGENVATSKITEETALKIIQSKGLASRNDRSVKFNVSVGIISSIDRGETWKHLPREPPTKKIKL